MKFDCENVTQEAAVELVRRAEAAAASGDFILDFEGVRRVDSTAVSLALRMARRAQAVGERLTLQNVPPMFEELVELYGLHELLTAV